MSAEVVWGRMEHMPGKPMHVLVAEALGWTNVRCAGVPITEESERVGWLGVPPDKQRDPLVAYGWAIPEYDVDWSVTGPLIERFGITVSNGIRLNTQAWQAATGFEPVEYEPHTYDEFGYGPTPLWAVCNLILVLHAAGKLPKEN